MKTLRFIHTGFILLALIGCTTPESDDTRRHDATYSTHNYKQPNKAAQAQAWEQSPSVLVMPEINQNPVASSYKQFRPGTPPSGGITIPYQSSVTMADRHYKTQNWLRNQPEPAVAKTPKSVPQQPGIGH